MTPAELIAYIRLQTSPKKMKEVTGLSYHSACSISTGRLKAGNKTNDKIKRHIKEKILQEIIDKL